MSKQCTTHYHACDCRETEFAEIKKQRDELLEELIIATGMIKEICHARGIPPVAATLRRLDAAIAKHGGQQS